MLTSDFESWIQLLYIWSWDRLYISIFQARSNSAYNPASLGLTSSNCRLCTNTKNCKCNTCKSLHDLRNIDGQIASHRSDLNNHNNHQHHDSTDSAEVIRHLSSVNLTEVKENEIKREKSKPRGSLGTALIEKPALMKHRNSAVSAISDK